MGYRYGPIFGIKAGPGSATPGEGPTFSTGHKQQHRQEEGAGVLRPTGPAEVHLGDVERDVQGMASHHLTPTPPQKGACGVSSYTSQGVDGGSTDVIAAWARFNV